MAIELRNLVKRYPGGVTALNDITLTIPIGMYGLLGHNGAGKTTLMRILATLLRPDAGQVTVFGHDVVREPQAVRRLLGYVPQKVGFYPQLTAAEMLELVAAYKGVPKDRLRPAIAEALELVNLHEFRRRPVRALSGGMLRRLAIAQAVLGDPKVIVVDEPTAGLDPEERLRLRNLLVELSVSRSVLLSTHIVEDIEDTCPTVSVLRRGSLCFEGSVPDLVRRTDVSGLPAFRSGSTSAARAICASSRPAAPPKASGCGSSLPRGPFPTPPLRRRRWRTPTSR
ncbi:ABC-type multidrug transport system ATPase subunit [Symbiobacterium terraclitae]|uniref:ABC-type multidrug transport system ATPase subunit n=1 Tax=Symbiobacterium terraclitae TaxID=557451 RepID=A0ABS4JX01_9FIRM|nr:ABC transporter ATP-binding protein [Symbiobacterium terraclitae]MBP2020049.1 ABC-type multidrug transport system ATPase subunit [Symbiobacterium terraclitae]